MGKRFSKINWCCWCENEEARVVEWLDMQPPNPEPPREDRESYEELLQFFVKWHDRLPAEDDGDAGLCPLAQAEYDRLQQGRFFVGKVPELVYKREEDGKTVYYYADEV